MALVDHQASLSVEVEAETEEVEEFQAGRLAALHTRPGAPGGRLSTSGLVQQPKPSP